MIDDNAVKIIELSDKSLAAFVIVLLALLFAFFLYNNRANINSLQAQNEHSINLVGLINTGFREAQKPVTEAINRQTSILEEKFSGVVHEIGAQKETLKTITEQGIKQLAKLDESKELSMETKDLILQMAKEVNDMQKRVEEMSQRLKSFEELAPLIKELAEKLKENTKTEN